MPLALPRVIGHRGAAAHAPENTLESIRCAAAFGVAMVEIDVQLSKDEVPVIIHDDTLERTTTGRGPVIDFTWRELQALDAGTPFGRPFAGERIPDLPAVLALCRELKLGLNVEIIRSGTVVQSAFRLKRSINSASRQSPFRGSRTAVARLKNSGLICRA